MLGNFFQKGIFLVVGLAGTNLRCKITTPFKPGSLM
jgi:hypothetical protein